MFVTHAMVCGAGDRDDASYRVGPGYNQWGAIVAPPFVVPICMCVVGGNIQFGFSREPVCWSCSSLGVPGGVSWEITQV